MGFNSGFKGLIWILTVVYGLELSHSELGKLLALPEQGNEDSCSTKCRASL